MLNAASPFDKSTSTSTRAPSRPITAQLCTFANIDHDLLTIFAPSLCLSCGKIAIAYFGDIQTLAGDGRPLHLCPVPR